MNSLNTASLVNLLGFTVGIALYALLLAMVVRHRRSREKFSFDFLLLATAILGLLWNAGELFVLVWKDFGAREVSPVLLAVSYSALGFLPSVVVHSAWKNSDNENSNVRLLTFAAYGLSVLASLLHFQSAAFHDIALSNTALQILTFGSLVLLAGLLIFNFKQTLEKKTIWITALLVFAVSALHLRSETEGNSWLVELVAHQSSLPLALAILLQDYRFAFADLFLKRALSLLLLTLTAFGLYVFLASPLLSLHDAHGENDVQSISILLTFWIATALIYPSLHRFAAWLVDKIILRRTDYEKLRVEISNVVEKQETAENVLSAVCQKLAFALTAIESDWSETSQNKSETNFPAVALTSRLAEIFVPTAESPFYKIELKDFSGGRRLLSDEIEMLGAVALLTARRIDALRVTGERYSREIREREFSKLAAEAELRALRAQINPHFLFNALTAIGYLINTAPEKASETLIKLTRLLRRVLKTSGEFSTLGEEIELVKSYLEIEQARFEERLEVEINVAKDLEKFRVPSFVLQPLVENAVKHGISKVKSGGAIKIFAGLEGEKENIILKLTVFDSGAGENTDEILQRRQKGVGLNNIEQRLHNYYGDSAVLKIKSESGKGTTAEIKIPVINAEARTK
ncbi:MAG TPA: histidine kinase [Pyrinomonadaceae bacterium]|nr:histidine kinase [Pyrinomonadaceae bacterium]